ncbi:unnamed protein product [Calypogeia fissa]
MDEFDGKQGCESNRWRLDSGEQEQEETGRRSIIGKEELQEEGIEKMMGGRAEGRNGGDEMRELGENECVLGEGGIRIEWELGAMEIQGQRVNEERGNEDGRTTGNGSYSRGERRLRGA